MKNNDDGLLFLRRTASIGCLGSDEPAREPRRYQ
jgi:hypothetical protein